MESAFKFCFWECPFWTLFDLRFSEGSNTLLELLSCGINLKKKLNL